MWFKNNFSKIAVSFAVVLSSSIVHAQRTIINFNKDWKFFLGDDSSASQAHFNDSRWRVLDVPHDWSIEGEFSEKHPTTFNQGALPAGIGWYRKKFTLPPSSNGKRVFINFDGVYRNSDVWINGHYLGKRPNGYISFRYDLTGFLKAGQQNTIAVKVDNSAQPSSRWYTGSGIYRKVWLEVTNPVSVDQWGVFVSTPEATETVSVVHIGYQVANHSSHKQDVFVTNEIFDEAGNRVAKGKGKRISASFPFTRGEEKIQVSQPKLWSVDRPYMYKLVTTIVQNGKRIDRYETGFGIRSFSFDARNGFFLNAKPLKILGVCNHHDLGALGAAVNKSAIERQLKILKAMGCNAIRTAHNPPATELLELCDRMGFLVMDEAFDMWKKRKNRFDYHTDFNKWYKKDLQDQVKRDRNHPSVFSWSIGNEIREQFDSTGITITRELVKIVKEADPTRPVTSALTENIPEKNFIYQSGALDILGFNYKHEAYPELPERFPGYSFIATETASALATRGYYEMPSDSNRIWPPDSKSTTHGNAEHTASAYDHVYAYWGASHEVSWNAVKKHDHMAGIFVWSGFDFLGEPVPYQWPSRSSYYGIIDLAGFPKDVYYMYQSEWTKNSVLHLFPHWNWKVGQEVDVWAYYNNADEVELFLNGRSLGSRKKTGDSLHVMWRVKFEEGTIRAVSRKNGKQVLTKSIRTSGKPARIRLTPDKRLIRVNSEELAYVTIEVTDADGNIVPFSDNLVRIKVDGTGTLVATDNGDPVSLGSFRSGTRKVFHGKGLAIVRPDRKGVITVMVAADGLQAAKLQLSAY